MKKILGKVWCWVKRHIFWTSVILLFVFLCFGGRQNVAQGNMEYIFYLLGLYAVFGSILRWIILASKKQSKKEVK